MTLVDPRSHNLRTGDVRFPTGVWIGVSGVSGSGKSTLVMDTLAQLLEASVDMAPEATARRPLVLGERVDKVVLVDQSPIGRNPRSTPATYCGILDPLRQLYASTPGARERGWEAGRFSFNTAGGRCETCEGRGATLVEMHFLPDVWVLCDSCKGRRFRRETLEVRYGGLSIADALTLRADEALEKFQRQRVIARGIQAIVDVGLGYLSLGQPGNTLSGGEAQRVKLAAELVQRKGHVVYVLDEPTTGLHLDDVAALVGVLHRLVEAGHTVITIEHHVEMLKQADWIVDLGPEAGAGGGLVVGQGPPAAIAKLDTPTGRALRG
jgi:excinuclease ABC subunit A